MILVDTGPLVALFDPRDGQHGLCRAALRELKSPLYTTVPVLVETFHMLTPDSPGSNRLRDFLRKRGLWVWCLDETTTRAPSATSARAVASPSPAVPPVTMYTRYASPRSMPYPSTMVSTGLTRGTDRPASCVR